MCCSVFFTQSLGNPFKIEDRQLQSDRSRSSEGVRSSRWTFWKALSLYFGLRYFLLPTETTPGGCASKRSEHPPSGMELKIPSSYEDTDFALRLRWGFVNVWAHIFSMFSPIRIKSSAIESIGIELFKKSNERF